MAEAQNDPLLPGYSFNAHLVAGLTPIEANGYLDFFIDRPLGMKGYILNLTIRGQGVVKNQGREFVCRPGDILLFPPGEIHHYGRHPEAREWYHQWVYFRPRAYWHEWLNWPSIFANTGFFRPDEAHQPHFSDLFGQIINAGQGEGRYSELLAINLLEQLLLRRMEAINESLHPPMDNRVREACQYISDHLADSNFDIASVAQHVCLSPSRLSHLFRQQLGISVLSWRCITRKVLPFTEQGHGFIAGLQRHPNHFRAFGDKDAPLRVNAVAQLGFGQGAEHFHSGMLQRGDFDNGHNVDFFE